MDTLAKDKPRLFSDYFSEFLDCIGLNSSGTNSDQDDFYIKELKFAGASKNKVLKYLRKFNNLTQVKLAENLGISNSYISDLEAGRKDVPSNVLELYSSYFGIPMSHLYLLIESVDNQDDLPIMVKRAVKFIDWVSNDKEKEKSG